MSAKQKYDLECTYFDAKRVCSVQSCSRRPVRRETGKCAPHSSIPYDESRESDFVDCYEGCIKHDEQARTRYLENKRNEAKRLAASKKPVALKQKTPIPNVERLFKLSEHASDVRDKRLSKLLVEALYSRDISIKTTAKVLNVGERYLLARIGSKANMPLSFMDVCDILKLLQAHDAAKKPVGKK